MSWLAMTALAALMMAESTVEHTNGDCMACQVVLWQWAIADAHDWDRLYMGCQW